MVARSTVLVAPQRIHFEPQWGVDVPGRFQRTSSTMTTTRCSAGLLVYRVRGVSTEVLLVHPGGPFWKNKDRGAWSIPKGEVGEGEQGLTAALREFSEETGAVIEGPFIPLNECRLKSGKRIQAWAAEADLDATSMHSNTFEIQWPPRSGALQAFPEVDGYAWFTLEEARLKINVGQKPLLDELEAMLLR